MVSIEEQFRERIEAFLKASEMTPSAFGWEALKDPNFVFEIRSRKRSCSAKTMDKVLAYIADKSTEQQQQAS